MQILTLDFETFFSDDFTLKKLTTEAYVRDPRFEVLMCGFRWQDGQREWVGQEQVAGYLAAIDWANTAVVCHHAHFDCLILSHCYGIKPRFIYDTLSMGRLVHGNHVSNALGSLAAHYGLDPKSVPYNAFRGYRWRDIPDPLRAQLGAGCLHDIDLTWDIFCRMTQTFPKSEYVIVDMSVRAFTEPTLVGDTATFGQVWMNEKNRKDELLAIVALELGLTDPNELPSMLQSADKFAEILRAEGIEPEMKEGKNGDNYAFAKTDPFMQDYLLEHEDDFIRTLAEARLGIKSTIDQTRAERLGYMSTRGAMCVYLAPYAAHTTRFGGGDKVNYQNFKRGSLLRKGHKAPPGYKAVKADKSQIECRILNYVAGQWDVIDRFARAEDPYVGIASKFYGRQITRADQAERGVGKQLELSCGYGAGGSTIVRTAKRGTYGPPVVLTETQGLEARDLYRATHQEVVQYWKTASRMIAALAGTNQPIQWGPMWVDTGVIWLPNAVPIWYPELAHDGENWTYKTRKGRQKLYGGKLTENVIQALSAVDMRESLVRIYMQTGHRFVHQEHDAAVWLVPEKEVDTFAKVVEVEMTRAPEWLPGIPLGCEVIIGDTL